MDDNVQSLMASPFLLLHPSLSHNIHIVTLCEDIFSQLTLNVGRIKLSIDVHSITQRPGCMGPDKEEPGTS